MYISNQITHQITQLLPRFHGINGINSAPWSWASYTVARVLRQLAVASWTCGGPAKKIPPWPWGHGQEVLPVNIVEAC